MTKLNEEFYYQYVNHVESIERISYTVDLGGSHGAADVSDMLVFLATPISDWTIRSNIFHVAAMEATRR